MRTDNIHVNTQSSIRIEGSSILHFDPLGITKESHDADVVLITHEHFDHFSPEDIRKISNENTMLIAPKSMENAVKSKLTDFDGKQLLFVDASLKSAVISEHGIEIEPVCAYNVGKKFHPKENGWLGYVVNMDDIRYYVAGDTDANEDNLQVKCDIALVPAGGTYTFTAEEAAEFVNKLAPKAAIPTHYGSIVGGTDAGAVFASKVDSGIEVVLKL